jgi:hypothetical protein
VRRKTQRERARLRAPIDVEGGGAPTDDEFRTAFRIIHRSGLVELLTPHVDTTAGRPRILPLRALLVAAMINALRSNHVALLTRITSVVNSFSGAQQRALGMEGWFEPGSYHRVQRLAVRIIEVLERWEGLGGTSPQLVSALDVLNELVEASCPPELLLSRSVAIDGTDIPSWAALSGDEDTVEFDPEEGPDELIDDVRNREIPKPARGKHKARVLGVGEDGRNIYTCDPTARAGWRSATNSRPAGPYIGREAHLMVQTSDVEWTNGVSDTKLGPRVPALVRGFSLTPAGTHRGKTATGMIKSALGRGARIDDVIVDPGYSLAKVETFLLPVQRDGLHVTFRPASYQWSPKTFNDDAITIGGQLFYAGVPEKMRRLTMPPMGTTLEEKRKYEEPHNARANYRYRLHAGPDSDGTTRWQNPFAAKSLRSEQLPASMRNARRGPLVELVNGKRPAATMSVSAADLPLQQQCIAGTTAHSISMSRRNAVEGVNGNLKRNFTNVDRGYTRVFGTVKIAFFLAFTLAGQNVMLARSYRRRLAREEELASEPKRRKKRRTRTFDQVLGPAIDSHSEVADAALGEPYALEAALPEEQTKPEGRAPP